MKGDLETFSLTKSSIQCMFEIEAVVPPTTNVKLNSLNRTVMFDHTLLK